MKYILYKDYEGKTVNGSIVKLSGDSDFESRDNLIYLYDTPICFATSQVAYEYFADNDDEQGELRGKWINRIAYWRDANKEGYRLTDDQQRVISEYYPRYIRHDCDSIIFNDKFYHLPISDYEMMAQDLGMKLSDMNINMDTTKTK